MAIILYLDAPPQTRVTSHRWNDEDEEKFKALLEKELDKIHDFQKFKTSELARRIASAENDVRRLVREEDEYQAGVDHGSRRTSGYGATTRNGDTEQQLRDDRHAVDGGSDDDLDTDDEATSDGYTDGTTHDSAAFEEQFRWLEEEVSILVADVHDLGLYTKLNLTGFMKILKV